MKEGKKDTERCRQKCDTTAMEIKDMQQVKKYDSASERASERALAATDADHSLTQMHVVR